MNNLSQSKEIKKLTDYEIQFLTPIMKEAQQMARLDDYADKSPLSVTKYKNGRQFSINPDDCKKEIRKAVSQVISKNVIKKRNDF